jgi:hypothetical protein
MQLLACAAGEPSSPRPRQANEMDVEIFIARSVECDEPVSRTAFANYFSPDRGLHAPHRMPAATMRPP